MAKSLKRATFGVITLAMMLSYFVTPAKAAMLYNASVTLSNPAPSQTSDMTFSFKSVGGGTVKGIKLQLLRTASPTSGAPTSFSSGAVADATVGSGLTGLWPIDRTDAGSSIMYITKVAGDAIAPNGTISFTIPTVTLPGISADATGTGCARRVDTGVPNVTDAVNSAGTCFVRVVTYSTDTLASLQAQDPAGAAGSYPAVLDYTTIAFTVDSVSTMKATVDASMAFNVVGLASGVGVTAAGATSTTSEQSAYNELNFKNLTVGSPKIMAQKLYVKTNAQGGYSVKVKATTDSAGGNDDVDGILKGQYADVQAGSGFNNIDGFANDGGGAATFAAPQLWASPTSAVANTKTGYIGVNSTDTRTVFTGGDAAKWAPLQNSTYNTVMYSTSPDLGGEAQSKVVSYAIEVNVYQPADQYTGTFVYQATPQY